MSFTFRKGSEPSTYLMGLTRENIAVTTILTREQVIELMDILKEEGF